MNPGIPVVAGLLALFVSTGSLATGDDPHSPEEIAAAEVTAAAEEVHRLSVYSFVQSWRGRSVPLPILITVEVKGMEGIGLFCIERPRIEESVLRALLGSNRLSRRNGPRLASIREPLLHDLNQMLPKGSVSGLEMRQGQYAQDFGSALRETASICQSVKN